MSDQTDSQVANEDTKETASADSQKQSDENNSLAGEALVEAILKDENAYETLRRKMQSDKDKGVAEALKTVEELQKQLNSQKPVAEQEKVETQTKASSVNIEAIKRAYPDVELDAPDVLPRIASKLNDPGALLAELEVIHQERAGKPKPAGATVTPPTGTTDTASSAEDIHNDIVNLLADRNKILTPKGRQELKELRAKLQEIENK